MKKILLSLFVLFVGIISFCSADFIGSFTCSSATTTCGMIYAPSNCVDSFSVYLDGGGKPFRVKRNSGVNATVEFYSGLVTSDCTYIEVTGSPGFVSTTYPVIVNYGTDPNGGGSCPACPECPYCPEVNTGEILSGYILESSIDENYCVSNNLCPVNTGDSASWSELVINDIVHESAPLIDITIPQEFEWDYTVNDNEFNMWVSGYNVDSDYIDGIITAQTVKPTTSDFNKIITELIPLFVPGLVIILFIWFVFRFIKKVF